MKMYPKGLVAILWLPAHFCFAQDFNIGIFSNNGNEICAAFEKSKPKPGDTISLVSTDPSDSVVNAKVGGITVNCDRLENSMINGPYFKIEAAKVMEAPPFGFAIPGAGKATNEGESIAWHAEGKEKPVYLRSCASSEGLHLTAWGTQNVVNKSQWHQYISLDYDLESNCSEQEVE